jgi:hypothetical protein
MGHQHGQVRTCRRCWGRRWGRRWAGAGAALAPGAAPLNRAHSQQGAKHQYFMATRAPAQAHETLWRP